MSVMMAGVFHDLERSNLMPDIEQPRRGAYGLHLPSIADQELLNPASTDWPTWHLEAHYAPGAGEEPDQIGDDEAIFHLSPKGTARISRTRSTTRIDLASHPTQHGEVHPYLATTAIMNAHWTGRTSFHSGAFVLAGGVWALLGDREQGKSSTLAWLTASGVPVFCDDMLVLDGRTALAGLRCLDLRRSAAERFGMGDHIGMVGSRHRWRCRLPAVPPALPFYGLSPPQVRRAPKSRPELM